MANTLIPRKSTIADKVPLPEQLAGGEVTVNWADQAWHGKHPGTGNVVPIGAPYLHRHDQLISLDGSRDLELTNAGSVVISDGTITTTLAPSSTVSRTLTLPDKSGTLATLDDVGGGTPAPTNDLDEMFTSASATYYHEVNYTAGGDVSAIEVYATSAKTTHLYSRAFTYDGAGNLTQVVTTDQQNAGVSLTKAITYSGSGDIATITRTYNL